MLEQYKAHTLPALLLEMNVSFYLSGPSGAMSFLGLQGCAREHAWGQEQVLFCHDVLWGMWCWVELFLLPCGLAMLTLG